jgi:hypothetical protein
VGVEGAPEWSGVLVGLVVLEAAAGGQLGLWTAGLFPRVAWAGPELIDHILASHAVTTHVADGDIDFIGADPRSIDDDPNADRDVPASDHRPLMHTVDLPV